LKRQQNSLQCRVVCLGASSPAKLRVWLVREKYFRLKPAVG
jgi:hypothetical protein